MKIITEKTGHGFARKSTAQKKAGADGRVQQDAAGTWWSLHVIDKATGREYAEGTVRTGFGPVSVPACVDPRAIRWA